MDEILRLLTEILNIDFIRGIISNPRDKTGIIKIKVRPLEKKGKLLFQIESFTKTQAFHENLTVEDAAGRSRDIWNGSDRCSLRQYGKRVRCL